MRGWILLSIFLIFVVTTAAAQGGFVIGKLEKISDDERAFLRKGFKLPDTASIMEVKKGLPSATAPLKVNLQSVLDVKVRESVAEWIIEWNKKESPKYRTIELVDDGLDADLTLVRYLRSLPSTDPISAMIWTDPKGTTHRLIPVYSYLIICKPSGLDILWRKVDLTYKEEYESSAKLLINALKKQLK